MLQIPTLQRIDTAEVSLRRGIEAADVAASESDGDGDGDGDGLNIRHLKGEAGEHSPARSTPHTPHKDTVLV
jgi:hypothetical protein